jgi:hypothetical protein
MKKLLPFRSIATEGYAFIEQFRPEESAEHIAHTIGVFDRNPGLAKTQQLRPKPAIESKPNLYNCC